MIDNTDTATIREWRDLPIGGNGVPPSVADRLHALADRATRRLRVAQPVLTRTAMPSLRAGQVVGLLAVPGWSVEILPKIGGEEDGAVRRALVHMLAVAWGVPVADCTAALLATQRKDLLETLVRLFADTLLAAVRRGLPHRYRLKEDVLPLLRGKLDMRRQLTGHAFRPDQFACSFDELSVDTPLNRVLKSAVTRLASATRSAENARRLAELSARFEFVGDSLDPMRERVGLDRTNTAFHRLHRLARLFLAGDWQSTATGDREGIALLFPMNDLFEEFVGRSMRVALAPRSVRLQDSGHYALTGEQGGLFALRPDIVVDNDIVIDTKWKELKPDEPTLGVAQADVYQMLAYGRAYQAKRLVLLYPWHNHLTTPGVCRSWRVKGSSMVLDIATVDIGNMDSVQTVLRRIVGNSG